MGLDKIQDLRNGNRQPLKLIEKTLYYLVLVF